MPNFRLFVSPRGFSNEGTIYLFPSMKSRQAAYDTLLDDDANALRPSSTFYFVSAAQARRMTKSDAATHSYVYEGSAEDFDEAYGEAFKAACELDRACLAEMDRAFVISHMEY